MQQSAVGHGSTIGYLRETKLIWPQIRSQRVVINMIKIEVYFETMAGTHLADAVRALRDSGSSDTLFSDAIREAEPEEIDHAFYAVSRDEARYEQVAFSRRALLFAAFAAEAYANDVLYRDWPEMRDREALGRLSTVDKYVMLPPLAGRSSPLSRGSEPIQTVSWLLKRRDELVHAAPKGPDLTYHPENHNPEAAAKCIIAVAEAASSLFEGAPRLSVLSQVIAERTALLEYGRRAAEELPDYTDPSLPEDLLRTARLRSRSSSAVPPAPS